MTAIDKLIYETFNWDWVLEYASLIFVIAAALAFILIVTIIVAAALGHVKKKKLKDAAKTIDEQNARLVNQEPLQDSAELRNELRTEMTPVLREEYERNYEEKYGKTIAELNNSVAEKDRQIAALNAALQNNVGANNSAETEKAMSDLSQTNKELREELNAMRMENASLRTQIHSTPAPAPAEQPARVKRQEPAVSTVEDYADEEDEEDEYDDEYGDENSDVKVTLKYDRIKMNWVIYRSDTTRAYRRFTTKQEALVIAKDLARRLHAPLVVHKRDGKFQKV